MGMGHIRVKITVWQWRVFLWLLRASCTLWVLSFECNFAREFIIVITRDERVISRVFFAPYETFYSRISISFSRYTHAHKIVRFSSNFPTAHTYDPPSLPLPVKNRRKRRGIFIKSDAR